MNTDDLKRYTNCQNIAEGLQLGLEINDTNITVFKNRINLKEAYGVCYSVGQLEQFLIGYKKGRDDAR